MRLQGLLKLKYYEADKVLGLGHVLVSDIRWCLIIT